MHSFFFFLFCTYSDNGRRNTSKFLEAYKNSLKRKCLTEPSIVDFMVSDLVGCMMIHIFIFNFRSYNYSNMGRSFWLVHKDKKKINKKIKQSTSQLCSVNQYQYLTAFRLCVVAWNFKECDFGSKQQNHLLLFKSIYYKLL